MSNACPPDYPDHVMHRIFYGADLACDCLGITHVDIEGGNRMNLGYPCDYNQTLYGCRQAEPIPPMFMHSFENKILCGKRGGSPFLNANRPDFETGKCPNATAPCSNFTSTENTICYDVSKDRNSECPITGFEFTSGKSQLKNAISKPFK
jgi:hypothetical protein